MHQVVGMVVVGLVVGQLLLGWRHHMGYLRTKNGTWMGRWHVWIGRSLMGLGWLNVMLGLWARGYGGLTLLGGGLVILAEAGVMIRVLWFRKKIPVLPGNGRRCKAAQQWNASAQEGGHGLGVEYFELVGDDDVEEDDDYDEDGRLKTDVEWEEGRRTKMGDEEGKERATKLQKLDVV